MKSARKTETTIDEFGNISVGAWEYDDIMEGSDGIIMEDVMRRFLEKRGITKIEISKAIEMFEESKKKHKQASDIARFAREKQDMKNVNDEEGMWILFLEEIKMKSIKDLVESFHAEKSGRNSGMGCEFKQINN